MSTYTLNNTSKTTLISVEVKKGGFKETLQYEFNQILTKNDIAKVYDMLSDVQKSTLTSNKNSFKQFIRAIKMRFPVPTESSSKDGVISVLLREEKTLIASRISKHIGLSSNVASKSVIGFGTIDNAKYDRLVSTSTSGTVIEEDNIIYWVNDGFVMAIKTQPSYQTESKTDMYIYVTLLVS